MVRSRLLLAAVVAAFMAAPAFAGPLNFVGGDAYSEANATGGAFNSQTRTFGSADFTGSSFANSSGDNFSGSSFFQHSASSTQIMITGTTQASGTGTGSAYGMTANDPTGTYGYVLDFTIGAGQQYSGLLNVNFQPIQSGTGTYSDIYAYLWNTSIPNFGELWEFGSTYVDGVQVLSGGNLINGPFPYPVTLSPGTYQLYIQSQSSVDVSGGSASSLANVGINLQITAAIPEPMSVMVFGGLVAVGGWVTRRRIKASA